jgi:flagellar FliJ protein
MKEPKTALLKRLEKELNARKVTELERMIGNFEKIASDLDGQIQTDELQTGIKDPTHPFYSTFAKAARVRRDNLRASANELRLRLEAAIEERDEAAAQRMGADDPREKGKRQLHGQRTDGAGMDQF